MSTAEFAAFSDNAIMFASIVYVLAFLAHLAEWVFLRSLPVPAADRRRSREPVAESVAGRWRRRPHGGRLGRRRWRRTELRVEMCGRIGVALTVRRLRAALPRPGHPRARLPTRSGCPGATCTSSR